MVRIRSSFVGKGGAAIGLVALGDRLFWQGGGIGSNVGTFAAAWAIVTAALVPAIANNRRALLAFVAAMVLALTLFNAPNFLALCLFWALLSAAALLPRYARFDDVVGWSFRLLAHGTLSAFGPWIDLFRLQRRLPRTRVAHVQRLLPMLPLSLIGGIVFLALFAFANPVIADVLLRIGLPTVDFRTMLRALLWLFLLITVWATLRPRRVMLRFSHDFLDQKVVIPGVSIGSVTLALIVFNALFAVQNGLDFAYLWSGAPLPTGVTLADYAHRSAYPLIFTALLAGLFVLVTLRPESDTASIPLIRRLVVLWIAQNVFLVASSILRTFFYIEAYSLTQLRIAALVWMLLVAIGLVLIVWRLINGRSGAWLVNANALSAALALVGSSVVDFGSMAATWNVRHAREVGAAGAPLDLCYLNHLGPSALTSLILLELRPGLDPAFAQRLAWVRNQVLVRTLDDQRTGSWTWRNARRLVQLRTILGDRKLSAPPQGGQYGRACDGTLRAAMPGDGHGDHARSADGSTPNSHPPVVAGPAPLTNEAEQ